MRALRNVIRTLADLPHGFSADGHRLGLGLDAALRAQRAHGIDGKVVVPTARPADAEDRPYSPVA